MNTSSSTATMIMILVYVLILILILILLVLVYTTILQNYYYYSICCLATDNPQIARFLVLVVLVISYNLFVTGRQFWIISMIVVVVVVVVVVVGVAS